MTKEDCTKHMQRTQKDKTGGIGPAVVGAGERRRGRTEAFNGWWIQSSAWPRRAKPGPPSTHDMPTEDEGKGETDSLVHENRERAQMFVAGVVRRVETGDALDVIMRCGELRRNLEAVADAILKLREVIGGAVRPVGLAGAVGDPLADFPVAFRQGLGTVGVAKEVIVGVAGEG